MRQINVNIYQFDELSDDAKQKALDNLRYVNVDGACDDWYKPRIAKFKAKLKTMGFEVDNVRFNGFCSQGDGASFTGEVVNFMEFCKNTGFRFPNNHDKLMVVANEDWKIRIERVDWHYCHAYTVESVISGYAMQSNDVKGAHELEGFLNDWEVEQANKLYRELEQRYDCLTSDKEVIEAIRANEWEFTEDGEKYKGGI